MQPQASVDVTIAFLLDENVTERLIMLLILLGYDATSVGRIGSKGSNDAAQLLNATALGQAIVTYDAEDYELLHHAWRGWSAAWNVNPLPQHAGILVIRPDKGLTAQEVADAIDALAQREPILANRFFGWTRQGGWKERP
jgi:hypothetical protein